ncbi:MAG: DNA-nicking Smr family endonuclease [Sulfitobacter sp.]|jgi:DNA-nicking Smr family endonuclease
MKRRGLNDEDIALWRRVTDRTERLDLKSLFRAEIDAPHPSAPALRRAQAALGGKATGQPRKPSASVAPAFADPLGPASVQMDKKAFTKLRRGKIKPEGKLDLHGMTLDQAHPVLNRYVLNAHRSGKRLILVVTGKGKRRDEGGPIPVRYGVLRHQVLHWLNAPPLSSVVMQVSQAHVSHGAEGAYYIYLRRHR